jgi:NAD(P)-dependent dehydrogenase (short-subunit alcohol dehydrogenase family)
MAEALLQGKVAVVSGAGQGLGRAICVALAVNGSRVVAGDIDGDALAATVEAVQVAGGEARGVVTDIRDAAACRALIDRAIDTYGALDVLVNDAYHGGDYQKFEDADLEEWRHTADVNVWGTLRMTQAALPHLKVSGRGRVVMICTHGVELIQPTFGAYTSSKATVAHLTKLLAAELGTYGIRVNAVFPGPILGPALKTYLANLADSTGQSIEQVHAEWGAKNSLGYVVPQEEIAGSVVFLASDLATPITGQAIYVDAGQVFH